MKRLNKVGKIIVGSLYAVGMLLAIAETESIKTMILIKLIGILLVGISALMLKGENYE